MESSTRFAFIYATNIPEKITKKELVCITFMNELEWLDWIPRRLATSKMQLIKNVHLYLEFCRCQMRSVL